MEWPDKAPVSIERAWGGAIILSKYHGFHPEGNGELLKSGLLLSLLLLQRSNNIRFLKNIPLTDETG